MSDWNPEKRLAKWWLGGMPISDNNKTSGWVKKNLFGDKSTAPTISAKDKATRSAIASVENTVHNRSGQPSMTQLADFVRGKNPAKANSSNNATHLGIKAVIPPDEAKAQKAATAIVAKRTAATTPPTGPTAGSDGHATAKVVAPSARATAAVDKGTTPYPGMNANTYTPIPESMAKQGSSLIDPKFAQTMAGAQYDPQINLTKLQQGEQTRDDSQHLTDIQSWYKQVMDSLSGAKTADKNLGADASSTITNATQGLLSSLGGSANASSGALAATGSSEAATQSEMGQAQNQYLSNMTPILASQGADAKDRQSAMDSQKATALQQQLLSLQGQRGQSVANNLMSILQSNNSTKKDQLSNLLAIKNANNTGAQQNFGNQLSLQELQQAQVLGNAEANYYKQSGVGATAAANAGKTWATATTQQKAALLQTAMGTAGLNASTGVLAGTPAHAMQAAQQYLASIGYTSALGPQYGPAYSPIHQGLAAILSGAAARSAAAAAATKAAGQ